MSRGWWWAAGALVMLLAAGGSNKQVRALVMTPRGIRNNNPGNIRRSSTAWQGMAALQADAEFVTFTEPKFGIRAMAKILMTYKNTHGLQSIRQIISRWAPPVENNTDAYVNHVAKVLGISADVPLTWNGEQLAQLIETIIRHENGVQPYDRALVVESIKLAGWPV